MPGFPNSSAHRRDRTIARRSQPPGSPVVKPEPQLPQMPQLESPESTTFSTGGTIIDVEKEDQITMKPETRVYKGSVKIQKDKMSYTNATYRILKVEGKSLHFNEIYEVMKSSYLLTMKARYCRWTPRCSKTWPKKVSQLKFISFVQTREQRSKM